MLGWEPYDWSYDWLAAAQMYVRSFLGTALKEWFFLLQDPSSSFCLKWLLLNMAPGEEADINWELQNKEK